MRTCGKCLKSLPFDNFNKKQNRKDGLQSWCKECNKIRSRHYYSENKEKHLAVIKENRAKYRKDRQQEMYEYLKTHPCVDCGFNDPRALEFDHIKNKDFTIAKMMGSYSWTNILKEIEKCEVRCSNCHSIKTAKQFNYYTHSLQALR